jgi:hypothetical protein
MRTVDVVPHDHCINRCSGLSKLQRRILEAIGQLGVATTADLLERVCGWEPNSHRVTRRPDGGLTYEGSHFFGYPRSHRVALSRALTRLESRGLVVRGARPIPGEWDWVKDHGFSLTAPQRMTTDGQRPSVNRSAGAVVDTVGETVTS